MNPTRLTRRAAVAARRRSALGMASASLVALMLIPTAAGADSLDEARARADSATARVAELQARVDQARREYQTALDSLSGAVTREIAADQNAQAAALAALVADRDRAAAVRALEQSGGSLAIFDSALGTGSPSEFVARWQLSTDVVSMLSSTSDIQRAAADRSVHLANHAEERTGTSMVVVADVQQAYTQLDALLQEQEDILATLDAEARQLAEAERIQQQIEAERAAAAAAASHASTEATVAGIPQSFLALYRAAAATCPGLPWPVLAAIGQVESGHGSNTGPSSSGAMGPMQFLPSTFAAYAVDGDGNGTADIWNPADAIFSAANYLCANGAGVGPRALYTAIWHYNHADWYVQMVMEVAGGIARKFGEPVPVADNPNA